MTQRFQRLSHSLCLNHKITFCRIHSIGSCRSIGRPFTFSRWLSIASFRTRQRCAGHGRPPLVTTHRRCLLSQPASDVFISLTPRACGGCFVHPSDILDIYINGMGKRGEIGSRYKTNPLLNLSSGFVLCDPDGVRTRDLGLDRAAC